ncbi:hypothetical protein P5F24_11130 [Clostridium perfringens]|nr:hypothetical protein [Clostridium perfringens]
MKAFQNFEKEIDTLEKFYYSTLLSYSISNSSTVNYFIKNKDKAREDVVFNFADSERIIIYNNYYRLNNAYEKRNKTYLDELIVIRLTSIFEYFIQETIEELFLHNKIIFLESLSKKDIKLYSHDNIHELKFLLEKNNWTSYINTKLLSEITRNTSKQIGEMSKFFKKIGVNFKDINMDLESKGFSTNDIHKMYSIRNTLVHQLGFVDKITKDKLNIKTNKIKLDVLYVNKLFKVLRTFGEIMNEALQKKYFNKKEQDKLSGLERFHIKVKVINENIRNNIVDLNFNFSIKNEVYVLRDLIYGFTRENDIVNIWIETDKSIKKEYLKLIKKAEKKGEIKVLGSYKEIYQANLEKRNQNFFDNYRLVIDIIENNKLNIDNEDDIKFISSKVDTSLFDIKIYIKRYVKKFGYYKFLKYIYDNKIEEVNEINIKEISKNLNSNYERIKQYYKKLIEGNNSINVYKVFISSIDNKDDLINLEVLDIESIENSMNLSKTKIKELISFHNYQVKTINFI